MTVRKLLVSASYRLSPPIVRRIGESTPIVLVNEFPKSGGTWLARLLSSATGLPFVDNSLLPVMAPSIIRNHWEPDGRIRPQVYVVRDGRDVMVSWFHHRAKHMDRANVRRRYDWIDFEAPDATEQLAAFIKFEFENPGAGVSLNWAQHVERGLELASTGSATLVRYEDLKSDTGPTLARLCRELLDFDPSPELLASAIDSNSRDFTRERESVESGQRSFMRSGQAGGWSSTFSPAAEEVFAEYAGDAMKAAGYDMTAAIS